MPSISNKSLITVIIPVYNAEKLITECIESVICQTVEYWNMILVNDGSSDQSGKICQMYAQRDDRITLINQHNGGPGKARNAGIDACKTPWFTFIDADDKLLPSYLGNFRVDLCKHNAVLSCQGLKRVDLKGNPLGEEYRFDNTVYAGENFMERAFCRDRLYSYGQSVGKLYNKSLCDKHNIRFNTEIRWSEDHLFYLQYLLWVEEIHTHAGCLYLYQLDAGQETLTHRPLPYSEAMAIFKCLYPAANAVVQKFGLEGTPVIDTINYHSVTAGFSNVLQNLYRENPNKYTRISILKELRVAMQQLHKKYNPYGTAAKLLKPMLLYFPLPLLDMMLSFKSYAK